MVFISLLFLIAFVVLDWFIAKEFYAIAEKKGYHDKKYFWWCFWCTGIGYSMVIALPDHGGKTASVEVDELPDL